MVGPRKTNFRYQATFYLICCILFTGCTNDSSYTIIKLHFKSADQVRNILQHALLESPEIKFSDQTVLIPSTSDKLKTVSALIKEIDKPPSSYIINLNPHTKNIKRRSTSNTKPFIRLTEGRASLTKIKNTSVQIEILNASNNTSLMSVYSYSDNDKPALQQNHWVIKHGQHNDFANDIFPNGFILIKE